VPGQYPDRIRTLPAYDGRFDAYRLSAEGADVLFASYPRGTRIAPHAHETENYGVIIRGELILTVQGRDERYGVGDWYHVPAGVEHAARFEQDTDEIEFWFEPGTAD
jgi:quercetin dioxygenase-like cupin family protein